MPDDLPDAKVDPVPAHEKGGMGDPPPRPQRARRLFDWSLDDALHPLKVPSGPTAGRTALGCVLMVLVPVAFLILLVVICSVVAPFSVH